MAAARLKKAGTIQNMTSDHEKGTSQRTKKMASKFAEILKVKPARFR